MPYITQLPLPSSSTTRATPKPNDVLPQQTRFMSRGSSIKYRSLDLYGGPKQGSGRKQEESGGEGEVEGGEESVVALVVAVLRKYSHLAGCNRKSGESCGAAEEELMEIGQPTDVRHVAHVTFDRFHGFLGLPAEFEPEVPRRPPSASTRVFGVSTESMQLSFDSRGNCVPTILLMMQTRLYEQGGLQSEGIFRINPENGQEEHVREQLNNGVIPHNIDVHCLAGLIKAWFRELPRGILDSLPPDQVMEAQTEEECVRLVKLLPPTEGSLLNWAVNLMADVAQLQHINKMNARNIAMVFAPNMTQMADPLTALMFAVQVMNFLKTLIVRATREREGSSTEARRPAHPTNHPDGENDKGQVSMQRDLTPSTPSHGFLNSPADPTNNEHEKGQVSMQRDLAPSTPSHGFLNSPPDPTNNRYVEHKKGQISMPRDLMLSTPSQRFLSSVENINDENTPVGTSESPAATLEDAEKAAVGSGKIRASVRRRSDNGNIVKIRGSGKYVGPNASWRERRK